MSELSGRNSLVTAYFVFVFFCGHTQECSGVTTDHVQETIQDTGNPRKANRPHLKDKSLTHCPITSVLICYFCD